MSPVNVSHRRIAFTLTCLVALALGTGCSSSTKGEEAMASFNKTRSAVIDAQTQVDTTMTAMDQMHFTGNLENSFSAYKSAVGELEKQYKSAKWRAETMDERFKNYIASWQSEMDSIQDPSVKATLESRKAAVESNFAQLRTAANGTLKAYQPYVKDNQDIVKALSINLSPATVKSLQSKMEETKANSKTVKEKLAAMQKIMANMAAGTAATPAAK